MNPDTEILYAQVPEREHNIFRNPCPVCDARSTRACEMCDRDFCTTHLYGYETQMLCGECYEQACTEDWLASGATIGNA